MRLYVKSYIHVGIVALLGECLTGNVASFLCAAEGCQLMLPVMTVLIRQNR